jgi:signal transduction histidine kinase
MRRRLLLINVAISAVAVLMVGIPAAVLTAGSPRGIVIGLACAALAVTAAGAVVRSRVVSRPLAELAEAADRLRSGDPRPIGRRYGLAELDQIADALDSSSRRVTSLLTAERELAVDASHQLRTPLTALSMRLEEVIAAADDPEAVREEGGAALAQAERLADVVSQLLDPARRSAAGTASLARIDEIVDQQVVEWAPAFRRSGRKLMVTGDRGLRAHVTPGGLAQILATLLDNAMMHGAGTVTIRISQNTKSVVIEVEDEGKGVPQELVSRIFERTVSTRPEGTGLGLYLARTMAAADGGRVVLVRQRPPVFAVFLPRRPPANRAQPVRSGPA